MAHDVLPLDELLAIVRAERWPELEARLTSLDVLAAVVRTSGVDQACVLYELPYEHGYSGPGLDAVGRALRQAAPAVRADPEQLAGQLLGRLDGCGDPLLTPLLEQAAAATAATRDHEDVAAAAARIRHLTGHEGPVQGVAVSPDGRRLVTGSSDRTVRVWDVDRGAEIAVLSGHEDEVTDVAVCPDGHLAVSTSRDGTVRLWDLERGIERRTLDGHDREVWSVAIAPDGRLAASGDELGTIVVWDLTARTEAGRIDHGDRCVNGVEWTRDGRRLLSAGDDGVVVMWDVDEPASVGELRGHDRAVLAVAVSPDGHRAVTASSDRTLCLWRLDIGALEAVLPQPVRDPDPVVELNPVPPPGHRGHLRAVNAAAFVSDASRVVSGSADGTLRVWDADTGTAVGAVAPRGGPIWSIDVLPGGRGLVSGAHDGSVSVWSLSGIAG